MVHSKNISITKRVCYTAVFTALVCAATFIAVPLPIGYFNLGDVFILLAAWLLPSVLGGVSAGLGAGLADLIMGYALYAPATLLIKFAVAIVAKYLYLLFKKAISKTTLDFLPRLLSAIVAECVMIAGYFFFESVILSYGWGATASLVGNGLQGLCAVVGATALISTLSPIKAVKNLFQI